MADNDKDIDYIGTPAARKAIRLLEMKFLQSSPKMYEAMQTMRANKAFRESLSKKAKKRYKAPSSAEVAGVRVGLGVR